MIETASLFIFNFEASLYILNDPRRFFRYDSRSDPMADGCQTLKMYRVAFVNTHAIQYFAPFYRYMNRTGSFDVTAIYLVGPSSGNKYDKGFEANIEWDVDLLGGYRSEFIGPDPGETAQLFSLNISKLWKKIRTGDYDALVIHGHNLIAHHFAVAAAKISGIPVFSRGDTNVRQKRPLWKQIIRTPIMCIYYKSFNGCLAVGAANRAYYLSMGVDASKIYTVPYAVDNDRFSSARTLDGPSRARVRARLGVNGPGPVILFAAKFENRKRPQDVIEAFKIIRARGIVAELVMVGAGALEGELRNLVEAAGLTCVSFPGFVNQAELPEIYAACDIFVLSSSDEPFGLAVNEAMCAGMPVVVSVNAGCVDDLVRSGHNGFTFRSGDIRQLASHLARLAVDAELRAKLGRASVEIIQKWSYREASAALYEAVTDVRAARRKK